MTFTVTWQGIVTAAAVLGALGTIALCIVKVVHWFDGRKKLEAELVTLRAHHDEDIAEIKEELTLLTYGLQGALRGLQELGCDGPVSEALNRIDKHINKKAHE